MVTQSEYVKHELIRLRQSLQELEDRAGTIEVDIRIAMSEGMLLTLVLSVRVVSHSLKNCHDLRIYNACGVVLDIIRVQ